MVHYNGALNKNKLTHDGKIFIVNDYDPDKKQIKKFSIVKNSSTVLVYSFKNIKFFDANGNEIKSEKPKETPKPLKTSKKTQNTTVNSDKSQKNSKPNTKNTTKPSTKKPEKSKEQVPDNEEPPL